MMQEGRNRGGVVATSVRMPREMRDDLKIQAIRAGRSFNTHVAMILAEALTGRDADALNEKDRQGGNPDGLEQSQL